MIFTLRPYIYLAALFVCLLLLSPVHAQDGVGGCPPGQIPYSGTDISSCGPMPDSHDQQLARPRSPPRWMDQWGAIATDFSHGAFGTSINSVDQHDAEQAAIVDCKAKGGLQCEIEVSYRNGCSAMTAGDRIHNSVSAASLDEATEKGLRLCGQDDTNCHVYYSGCSFPKRIL